MRDEYRRHIGRPVMVEVDGNTVGGTLARVTRREIVLTAATLVSQRTVPMDGTVAVTRARVTWVQVAD